MFIYAVRARSVKFFAVLLVALAVLLGILLGGGSVPASAKAQEINFSGIKTEEDRIAFIKSAGVEINPDKAAEEASFVMPERFDRVMLGYNEIQKRQGLDLSKYAKKKVTRYTYEVKNYDGYEGIVLVNLLVYRNKIIGCDVCSSDPEGFVEPLIKM
jgi:hypothetical protein